MVRFRSVVLSSSSQPNVVKGSYQWNDYLEKILTKVNESGEGDNRISEYVVPAECFFEAPFVEFARYIVKNLKVEVALEEDTASLLADESISLFWVASVQKVAGYRVLVRFEGMDQVGDESNDVWINLGSAELRHVGFCSEDINTRVLVPPPEIAGRQSDWSHYLMCQLHAYKTLPVSWPELQHRKINCCKFKKGDRVELLDSLVSMRVRPAVVEDVVGGRIFLKISAKDMNKADMQVKEDDDEFDAQLEEGVWMDQYSPLIFYVGWAYKVGYQLLANDAYKKHAMVIANALKEGITNVPFSKNDTRPEQFQNFVDCWHEGVGDENKFVEWEKGMKLEVLDPLDTWKELRVATVIEVLADGYLKLGFDGEGMEDDCIAIHCASPLLFPVGYCERNGLKLKGPQGGGKFDWKSYLRQSKSITAPEALFDEENEPAAVKNFKIGAKLEAVDMCEPHLICVATVAAHKGRLLQIKYDGWDNSYDQLFDYRSTNIFPLGWCEMNGYKLEAPKTETKKKARSRRK